MDKGGGCGGRRGKPAAGMSDTVRYVEKFVRDWKKQTINYKDTELRGLLKFCKRCNREEYRLQTSLYFTGAVPEDTKKYTASHRNQMSLRFHMGKMKKKVGLVVAIKERNIVGFSLFVVDDECGVVTIFCLLVAENERHKGIGAELIRRTQGNAAPLSVMIQFDKMNDYNLELWKPWVYKLGFSRMKFCQELGIYKKSSKNHQYAVMLMGSREDLRRRYLMLAEDELLRNGRSPSVEMTTVYMENALRRFEDAFSRHFPGEIYQEDIERYEEEVQDSVGSEHCCAEE